MHIRLARFQILAFALSVLILHAGQSNAQTSTPSTLVTWTCTGSPCWWGNVTANHAFVWPQTNATNTRLGYTTSAKVYLPRAAAETITVKLTSGAANAYAGLPNASSHRNLGSLPLGQPVQFVGNVGTDEVLSIQGASLFSLEMTQTPPPTQPPPPPPPPSGGGSAGLMTWTCTGSPCPYGSVATGYAFVWPASAQPLNTRLGYTVNGGVYLPKTSVAGITAKLTSGSATAYAGLPNASSHRTLGNFPLGQAIPFNSDLLAAGEVLSIQSASAFTMELVPTTPPPPPPPPPPGQISWTCTGTPCPWGQVVTGYAVVWDAAAQPTNVRLGYTTSAGVYLPASSANGTTVQITSGSAQAFAGTPTGGSHRLLANIGTGQTYQIQGVVAGEVVSVQSSSSFASVVTLAPPPNPGEPEDPPPPPGDPGDISSVPAFWRCPPGCYAPDWVGHVLTWPSWSAFENNNRAGDYNRTVYSASGQLLYPYMGAWANGCQVTAKSGTVLIIEWQRGTDVWQATTIHPGQTHTIQLTSPENGALIESEDASPHPFTVSLNNCTPQVIQK